MKVLIVGRQRLESGVFVDGLALEGHDVRWPAAEPEPGEIWELLGKPAPRRPPHTEDWQVDRATRLGRLPDFTRLLEILAPPQAGPPDALFGGRLKPGPGELLSLGERTPAPASSVLLWRPDRPLLRVEANQKVRYRYEGPAGARAFAYAGAEPPPASLPAGSLLRVCLSDWWRHPGRPSDEARCFAQITAFFEGAPAADPMLQARRLLKEAFGHEEFRPFQAKVIENALARRDTLAILPTGSGKSVCYQLPALLFEGLTVVVSPLIALMRDQVDQLQALGLPADLLNSSLDPAGYSAALARVRGGRTRLLYLAPETLAKPDILGLLDRARLDCIAIDEAHCISSWGHDFREEYRQLRSIRARYPQALCLAFTATATPRVQQDIAEILGLPASAILIDSFDRPNLLLAAAAREKGPAQLQSFLESHRDQSGIIYCHTRKQVDELAARLAEQGWGALPYHAGLDDATRQANQRAFLRDETPIMVATIAFGLGINKSNVRFVLHHNLPQDLESYYQEIGRAGRDGLPADCLLLFQPRDAGIYHHFIEEGAESERQGRQARLQAMLRYAQTNRCRRVALLEYFGETFEGSPCGGCDVCLGTGSAAPKVDITDAALQFLGCVRETGQRFGVSHIADVLHGSRREKVIKLRHDRLASYAKGAARSDKEWRRIGQHLIGEGLLDQDMSHGGLSLTPQGQAVLSGEAAWSGAMPVLKPAATPAAAAGSSAAEAAYDEALFDKLRALRKRLAQEADVPPYVVFSDRSLVAMARQQPRTEQQFLAIDGVGKVKLERYGELFLQAILEHAGHAEPEASNPDSREAAEAVPAGERRFRQVGEAFAAGNSLQQLQTHYGVSRESVLRNLLRYLEAGGGVDARRLMQESSLSEAERREVFELFSRLGSERLREVFEALDGAIPYPELHLARLAWLAREPGES